VSIAIRHVSIAIRHVADRGADVSSSSEQGTDDDDDDDDAGDMTLAGSSKCYKK
jgi:hypothetical protein